MINIEYIHTYSVQLQIKFFRMIIHHFQQTKKKTKTLRINIRENGRDNQEKPTASRCRIKSIPFGKYWRYSITFGYYNDSFWKLWHI